MFFKCPKWAAPWLQAGRRTWSSVQLHECSRERFGGSETRNGPESQILHVLRANSHCENAHQVLWQCLLPRWVPAGRAAAAQVTALCKSYLVISDGSALSEANCFILSWPPCDGWNKPTQTALQNRLFTAVKCEHPFFVLSLFFSLLSHCQWLICWMLWFSAPVY